MENTAGRHHGQVGVDFGAHYNLPGPVRARSTRSSGVPRPRRRRRRSNTQRAGLLAIVQCGCYISGHLIGTTSPLGERVVILVPEVLLATFIGLHMGRFARGSVIIQNEDVLRDNYQPENLEERRRTRRVRSAIDANHVRIQYTARAVDGYCTTPSGEVTFPNCVVLFECGTAPGGYLQRYGCDLLQQVRITVHEQGIVCSSKTILGTSPP